MLRRRKDQMLNGKVMIELPARNIEIVSCPFSPAELAFYQELELKMGNVLEDLMDSGKANSYVSVLVLLLRLRQGILYSFSIVFHDTHPLQPAITLDLSPKTTRPTWMQLNQQPPRTMTTKTSTQMILLLLSNNLESRKNVKFANQCMQLS